MLGHSGVKRGCRAPEVERKFTLALNQETEALPVPLTNLATQA